MVVTRAPSANRMWTGNERSSKFDGVAFCIALGLLAGAGCGGATDESAGDTEAATGGEQTPESSEHVSLRGVVLDAQGEPISDVTVETGAGTATTGADGRFSVDADHGTSVVLIFRKPGFVRGLERVDLGMTGDATTIEVTMIPMAPPVPFDSSQGGVVVGMRGAEMNAPPNAFRTRSGEPVSGMVEVQLTPMNPSIPAELEAYPGDNLARDASGETIQLETFGVVDVTVTQGDEDLDIVDGMGVDVKFPLPDPMPAEPPETIALWGFDDDAGVWVEEGVATLNLEEGVYEGTITHLSPWNCDQPLTATCVTGRVVDESGAPVPGAYVTGSGVDYSGSTSAVADADGEFALVVRKDSTIDVKSFHPNGGQLVQQVMSGAADTDIPADPSDTRCLDVGDWVMNDPGGDGWDDSCDWGDDSSLQMTVSGYIEDAVAYQGDPWLGLCGGITGAGGGDSFTLIYSGSDGFPLDIMISLQTELGNTGSGIPATVFFSEDYLGYGDMWFTLDGDCSVELTRNDLLAPGIAALEGRLSCSAPATSFPTGKPDIDIVGPAAFSGVVLFGDAGSDTLLQCCYGGLYDPDPSGSTGE